MKILVVEDNRVSAEMLKIALKRHRYELVVARSGADALACLRSTPDISIVITDVMMPGMSGLDLLEQMRQVPECSEIPVILATAAASEDTVRKAGAMGCKHFMVKPINIQLLLDAVRATLNDAGSLLQEKARVLARVGIDAGSYDQIARTFASLVDEKLSALEQLCRSENNTIVDSTMSRDLLDLSEGATILGAERLSKILARLDCDGERAESPVAPFTLGTLVRELRLLQSALSPSAAAPSAPDESATASTPD
jgi:CheY-like chemotaxis protein